MTMITIHQMLHGYKLGHNYIQGSIVLPSTHDMDKIATLSDWSEYVGIDNERDYITVYPLEESPYYVVAKTWYADGMRRPGCVWTHSLLISNEDLDKIDDYCSLLPLFEAPVTENDSVEQYAIPLHFDGTAVFVDKHLSQLAESTIGEAYEDLLSTTPIFFLSEMTSRQSQELLLSLLNYLPVELLKEKSLCSGTSAPRSYEGKYLSLQGVTREGGAVKFFNKRVISPWAQLVANSIILARPQVARLIRRYQDELGNDVQRLVGFLYVVVLINRRCKDEDEKQQVLLDIINTLSLSFPIQEEGNQFKVAVFQPLLANDFGGEVQFLYTISTVNVASFTQTQVDYRNRLHNLSTEQFLELLKRFYSTESLNEWGTQTVYGLAQYISYTDISSLITTDKSFFLSIVGSSKEIFNQIVWSDFTKEELQSVLTLLSDMELVDSFNHWHELLKVMLEKEISVAYELARMAFARDSSCTAMYLSFINHPSHQPQPSLSKELEKYQLLVLDWLDSVSNISYNVAYMLVNVVDELDSLVKSRGSRIWEPLYQLLNDNDPIQYFVYLYRLSFNWSDANALAYMRKAFYPIHRQLANDNLSYGLWFRVEPYTEHLFFFQEWDKCKKLRKAVIKRLKYSGADKSVLREYTPDMITNEYLMNEW